MLFVLGSIFFHEIIELLNLWQLLPEMNSPIHLIAEKWKTLKFV